MKGIITVTNKQDNEYFNGKLPTINWGYAEITRTIRNYVETDEGYEGEIKTPAGIVKVESVDGDNWNIC